MRMPRGTRRNRPSEHRQQIATVQLVPDGPPRVKVHQEAALVRPNRGRLRERLHLIKLARPSREGQIPGAVWEDRRVLLSRSEEEAACSFVAPTSWMPPAS